MNTTKVSGDFFEIDPEKLDEQWFRFARDYFDHACNLANAREEFERAKARRDVIEAELDREIRLKPENFGVAKITETQVERTIRLQKRYDKANEEVIIAKHTLDLHQATVDAMDVKKKGLEMIVQLRLSTYYAEPYVRGQAAHQMADAKIDRALSRRDKKE